MTIMINLRRRGFTLMETVLVIAVGLGLLIGGIIFYQQAQDRKLVVDSTRIFNSLSAEIRAAYDNKFDYTGLSAASLAATSSLPAWMFQNLVLQPYAGAHPRFSIQVRGLEQKICQRIIANQDAVGPKPRQFLCLNQGNDGYAAHVQYGR